MSLDRIRKWREPEVERFTTQRQNGGLFVDGDAEERPCTVRLGVHEAAY